MVIATKRIGTAAFVDLAGKLTVDIDTKKLHDAVQQLIQRGARVVVLDLANVTRLDCSGIGQLIELRNRTHQAGAAFGLLNVGERHLQMLDLLGILNVCRVLNSAEETRPTYPEEVEGTVWCVQLSTGVTERIHARP